MSFQEDSDGDGIGDACELFVVTPEFFGLSTNRLTLAVGNTGNFGNGGTSGQTMDYSAEGDCESIYLYDASPIVLHNEGSLILTHHLFGSNTTFRSSDGLPAIPPTDSGGCTFYFSGTILSEDAAIAIEKSWWASQHPDSSDFLIQRLLLYSWDGYTHNGVVVGEALDWDIPSSSNSDNSGGFDSDAKMVYQRGLGSGCQDNTRRFGAVSLIGTGWGLTQVDTSAIPFGAYTESNPVYVYPTGGFVPSQLYGLMTSKVGYYALPTTTDQHSVMTYFDDLSLGAADTVTVYSVVATVKDGTVDDLINAVERGKSWFNGHFEFGPPPCCVDNTGNVNCDPEDRVDIEDLTELIDHLFINFPELCCPEEANVDGDEGGNVDIVDLTELIDHLFISFKSTAPCL